MKPFPQNSFQNPAEYGKLFFTKKISFVGVNETFNGTSWPFATSMNYNRRIFE